MMKHHENKLTMAKGVSTFLSENLPVISVIPELVEYLSRMDMKVDEIESKDTERKTIWKGKLKVKRSEREDVTVSAMAISGALHAYAIKSGKIEIRQKTEFTKSDFDRMRDTELIAALIHLKELAEINLQSLEAFGVTRAKLDVYSQLVARYEHAVGQSESARAIQKGGKKSLVVLFREMDEILIATDSLINGLGDSNPEFVRNYRITRRIFNPGIRHRKKEEVPAGINAVKTPETPDAGHET